MSGTGITILDCFDSQTHGDAVTLTGATNGDATHYRAIRSSADCSIPYSGKAGTGANFSIAPSTALQVVDLMESYSQAENIVTINQGTVKYPIYGILLNGNNTKAIGCRAKAVNNHRTYMGHGFGFTAGLTGKLAYNCIAHDCDGDGFSILPETGSFTNGIICCTAYGNGRNGFRCPSKRRDQTTIIFNCYGANNAKGDFADYFWQNPSGWNASKDNTAVLGGATSSYKILLDLITLGYLDSTGIALVTGIFGTSPSDNKYGRNPYNELSSVDDFGDFFKNDGSGYSQSKKDIAGAGRPNPDTLNSSWNVGASEYIRRDGLPTGGIVFGGLVASKFPVFYTDPSCSNGIVFSGLSIEVFHLANHGTDATPSNGIVFGGLVLDRFAPAWNDGISAGGIVFTGSSIEEVLIPNYYFETDIPLDGIVFGGLTAERYIPDPFLDPLPSGGIVFDGAIAERIARFWNDGISSNGIIFGGIGILEGHIDGYMIDPLPTGGIIFGGLEISSPTNYMVESPSVGGIIFGGNPVDVWFSSGTSVAVKGGAYRINGITYILPNIFTIGGLGLIAGIVECGASPTIANYWRYDLLSVGVAGVITLTKGAETLTPVMPALPTDHVKLDHVLRYYGQTNIAQSDIGKTYYPPAMARIKAVASDADLAWGQNSSTITITCYNQYDQIYRAGTIILANIISGNGTITPLSKTTGYSGIVTFLYTRGGSDPGDESPMIQFTAQSGANTIISILVRDAAGDIMMPTS